MRSHDFGGVIGAMSASQGAIEIYNCIIKIKFNVKKLNYSGIISYNNQVPEVFSENNYVKIDGCYIIGGNYVDSAGGNGWRYRAEKHGRGVIAVPKANGNNDTRTINRQKFVSRFNVSNVFFVSE